MDYSKEALDAIDSNIAVINGDGEILMTNAAWERFSDQNGGDKSTCSVGSNYLSFTDAASGSCAGDAIAAGAGIREVLSGKRETYSLVYPCHSADSQSWYELRVTPLEGVTDGVLVNHIDVTDRIQSETQSRKSQKLESVGQLAAGVAHEINTPAQFVADNISFIRDSFQELSELLSEYQKISAMATDDKAIVEQQARIRQMETDLDLEFLTDELPRAIGEAEDGLKRISSIVRSMKEFAHPSSDAKAVFDLNVAIKRTVNVARNEWKYSAELEFQFAKEVIEVPGFEGEFNQVILIMVVNAAQAIREDYETRGVHGLGKIRIETIDTDDFAAVRIIDNGPGIPDRIIEKIFDPFFTTKEIGKGSGQGLSIGYSIIVDKHHGQLFVDSVEGVGTAFTLLLPHGEQLDEDSGHYLLNSLQRQKVLDDMANCGDQGLPAVDSPDHEEPSTSASVGAA